MSDSEGVPLIEIAVETAGIDSELVADAFRQACPAGVAVETPSRLDKATETYVPDGDSSALVKGYVPATEDAERIRQSLQIALSGAPLDRPLVWRENTRLEETDWRDSWKKYFGVQKIGRAMAIVPSWVDYRLKDGETAVRIDPGMAFGTGQHPTTAMCLAGLEAIGCRDAGVLDLGCGSGILSIAAALLGARRVVALDIDPQAIKATNDNAESNGVAGVIQAAIGTLEAGEGPEMEFDVVLANISGLTLDRLAPEILRSLKADGRLVASGFLDDAVDGLKAAFEATGFEIERVEAEGVWRAIVARRQG
ncbi:MAG TPA: 50S ribosomal protein L11 methyltransferase [Dehalococcoidia bacterium]|nr:50S ribosomal protein L11 methyltransferase [Dehalococcoidia bacterium]